MGKRRNRAIGSHVGAVRRDEPLRCSAASAVRFAAGRCMTMNAGLFHIQPGGLGGSPSDRPESATSGYRRSRFVWLPVGLIAGFGVWVLLTGYVSKPAGSEPMRLTTAVPAEPAATPAAAPAPAVSNPP